MTDKRWKAVERSVAEELNRILSGVGNFSSIERIPLLGRDGPDLTMNEAGLVINVKSRKTIHPRLFPSPFELLYCDSLVIFAISELTKVNASLMEPVKIDGSRTLQGWYDQMETWTNNLKQGMTSTTIIRHSTMPVEKWTDDFKQNCISAIILHRPRMPFGKCAVAIDFNNLRRLSCNLTQLKVML